MEEHARPEKGGRLTIKEDEAEKAGGYHDHVPGDGHAHSQPQLAHAVAEVILLHHRLSDGLPRAVRVRLLPPLCMQHKACTQPVRRPLPLGMDYMLIDSLQDSKHTAWQKSAVRDQALAMSLKVRLGGPHRLAAGKATVILWLMC